MSEVASVYCLSLMCSPGHVLSGRAPALNMQGSGFEIQHSQNKTEGHIFISLHPPQEDVFLFCFAGDDETLIFIYPKPSFIFLNISLNPISTY